MAYGNDTYQQSAVGGLRDTVAPPSLEERLSGAIEQIEMAHNTLDSLQNGPEKTSGQPPVRPSGVLMAGDMVFERARVLRERVQEIAQRIGRL